MNYAAYYVPPLLVSSYYPLTCRNPLTQSYLNAQCYVMNYAAYYVPPLLVSSCYPLTCRNLLTQSL
jgi:hypothetical protein